MTDFGPADVDTSASPDAAAYGAPGSSEPGFAAASADRVARAAYPSDWQASGAADFAADSFADEFAGTSQVYSSYTVNRWTPVQKIYPHKWVGRFSFHTSSGTSYCSATAISNNHIVTAAHCVYDTASRNVWYTAKVFTPAYRDGNAPYGTFPTTACTILTAWVNLSGSFAINSWTQYDVAVCQVGTNSAGQTLNNAVGYAGRQWDYGYVRSFFDMGYPFNNYLDNTIGDAGKFLRTCASESFQQATDVLGTGCNWSRGISGGPWLIAYAPPTVSGYVNSVNSGFFVGTANLYGIRFNSNNIVVLCNASGC